MGASCDIGQSADLFWARIRSGEIINTAATAVGASKTVGGRWFREAGGVMPPLRTQRSAGSKRLLFAEREEIACRRAVGESMRVVGV
jgi:hypothetical protein